MTWVVKKIKKKLLRESPEFFELKDSLTIGRENCNIVIDDDPKVSRLHCTLYLNQDEPIILDNSSRNGTYLNGDKVSRAQLTHDDKIVVGKTELYFLRV